jgi:PAS domain S-box-containing protein
VDKKKGDQFLAEELRRQAEARIGFEDPLPEEISPAEAKKLIHELRVHQIELEMQNDELRQAQTILEESRSRYSDLYDFAPIGYLTLDELGIIREANLTAVRHLQVERSRLIDRQFTHFLVTEDRGAFRRHLNLVLQGRERQTVELRLKREDGKEVFILLESVFHQDTARRSLVRTAFSDISKRRQAEADLQRQQEELKIILDSVPAMIFYKDQENRFIRTNKALTEATGLPKEDMEGKSVFDLYPAQAEYYWKDDQEVMRSGKPKRNIVETLETPEGVRCVQTDKIPYCDDQGNIIGVVGFSIDITERIQAEEALKDSEERFRTMANAIPQLAWIARSDGYIFWYNQRWHDYTGTTPEEMEGWGWQIVHDPEVLPTVLEQWRTSIATGRPFDMIFPLRGKNGQFRQFLTRVMPMKGADGHVIQWFGTNTDITDRKQAEEALKQAHNELEQE